MSNCDTILQNLSSFQVWGHRQVRIGVFPWTAWCHTSLQVSGVQKVKHEYLRSRASRCLSLSSSFSSSSVTVSQFLPLSRYSCLYLGSCIQEFLSWIVLHTYLVNKTQNTTQRGAKISLNFSFIFVADSSDSDYSHIYGRLPIPTRGIRKFPAKPLFLR